MRASQSRLTGLNSALKTRTKTDNFLQWRHFSCTYQGRCLVLVHGGNVHRINHGAFRDSDSVTLVAVAAQDLLLDRLGVETAWTDGATLLGRIEDLLEARLAGRLVQTVGRLVSVGGLRATRLVRAHRRHLRLLLDVEVDEVAL